MQGAVGSSTFAILFRLGSHALSASNGLCPQEQRETGNKLLKGVLFVLRRLDKSSPSGFHFHLVKVIETFIQSCLVLV
jgi:hypothetical protein